ncbi:hypothetical protein DYB30_011476 [Aphanomyces astaci]|uniref:Uncharacterized protein n=2 Tax=Aphanomyces astaci TaxID=112090 RepID=A0A397CMK5_APHAT|nr:hypothetical protein DYB38_005561 [Aphanomyces astaci]RHY48343.1 hypothetical protein DYB30_011476 [Aphanomyces astaci]RHY54306.1 hypothetical protein DYB34_005274 [Aphanomyces astaci]
MSDAAAKEGTEKAANDAPKVVASHHAAEKNPWLHAYHNSVAGIKAFTKIYVDERASVVGCPRGVECLLLWYTKSLVLSQHLHAESTRPRTPSIAVASGPSIYIYRNMRPYYKFAIPVLDVDPEEDKLWTSIAKCETDIPAANHQLNLLRANGIRLTQRSRGFLAIDDIDQQADYVSRFIDEPLVEQTTITCMTTINKNMDEKDAISCLVVGTEACQNGELLRSVIELESPACGLLQMDKNIIVACVDRKVISYHLKGKKNWSMSMSQDIVALEAMNLRRTKHTKGILIALRKGEILLYHEKIKVHSFNIESSLTAMLFGQFGREEASLVLVHKTGALTLKILQRNADLEASATAAGPPPEQARSVQTTPDDGPLNSGTKFASEVPIALHYDHTLYRVDTSLFVVPLLLPGVPYAYTVDVESVASAADSIYIFVCGKDRFVLI